MRSIIKVNWFCSSSPAAEIDLQTYGEGSNNKSNNEAKNVTKFSSDEDQEEEGSSLFCRSPETSTQFLSPAPKLDISTTSRRSSCCRSSGGYNSLSSEFISDDFDDDDDHDDEREENKVKLVVRLPESTTQLNCIGELLLGKIRVLVTVFSF